MMEPTSPRAGKGRPGRTARRGQVLEERRTGKADRRRACTLEGSREVLRDGDGKS